RLDAANLGGADDAGEVRILTGVFLSTAGIGRTDQVQCWAKHDLVGKGTRLVTHHLAPGIHQLRIETGRREGHRGSGGPHRLRYAVAPAHAVAAVDLTNSRDAQLGNAGDASADGSEPTGRLPAARGEIGPFGKVDLFGLVGQLLDFLLQRHLAEQ